jgi:hypothetical protein
MKANEKPATWAGHSAAAMAHTANSGGFMAEIRSASYSATKAGIGFGSALAITISWSLHKSVLWAIIHGFLSWLYVAYYVLTR